MKILFKIILTLVGIGGITAIAIVVDGLTDNIQKSDVIVVLGNKVEFTGEPSPALQSRLDRTIEVYQAGIAPIILVSGGFGKEGFDEPTVMKAYLVAHGIPIDIIFMDHEGIDSFNTTHNTKAFLTEKNLNTVLIISNYYHISRTRLAMKKFGIETVYSAHAHYFKIKDLYSIPREVIGYYYYLFRKY